MFKIFQGNKDRTANAHEHVVAILEDVSGGTLGVN